MGCGNIVQEDGLIDDVGARQGLGVSDGSWRFGVRKAGLKPWRKIAAEVQKPALGGNQSN